MTCRFCRPDKSKVKKSAEKLESNFPKIHSKSTMFVYVDTSRMYCIIYELDFHNLQTRKKVWNGANSTNTTFHK